MNGHKLAKIGSAFDTKCGAIETYLSWNLYHSVGARLPRYNSHLLLYRLDIWGILALCPVREGYNTLCILAFLLCPILRSHTVACQHRTTTMMHYKLGRPEP